MKPFLLLATRAEDEPAEAEFEAFCRFGSLAPDQLERRRLEAGPLGEVDLDRYSGIILGGSPFTVSDPAESKSAAQVRVESELAALLDEVVAADHPFLGACYGIGVIGSHQGGLVDRTYPEPVGPTWVELTAQGRDDPLLGAMPQHFEAFVGHKEGLTVLPESAVALASSTACPVQAFRVGSHVYATQFHPELDVEGILTRIEAYKHYGYFAPHEAEELKTAARASDVHLPGRLVRRFVELYATD